MSKDKGSREKKKLPDPAGKKGQSDYQAGKKSASQSEIFSNGKKK
ncbi:hypothetical protein [Mucilaginibacter sp.]|jgi:hypothetical protein|nr:hypothetical protein [Mucilaginibacter sp.]HTI57768.1 hypothetical protein [Mucilaginibacter sp.]